MNHDHLGGTQYGFFVHIFDGFRKKLCVNRYVELNQVSAHKTQKIKNVQFSRNITKRMESFIHAS